MRKSRSLLPLLIVATGCWEGGEPAAAIRYNPEQARTVLIATLDAWKKGEAKTLPKRNPPIRFVDDDFIDGLLLADYEIDEPDGPIGPHKDVNVILSLRDAYGKTIHREARYQVATEPALAVLRSDR
ncbi:hypothetical protein [Singulisphaera acidiphila]|uniref:Uncharacterized protein n=1 Tax=Singulisphaera acidiphila (strain ATCC BAA-1392 / DSM 18658 / VKM B-2454 / MOB10) TaxID=886293 RepID=L0DIJ7_SINAD|nr:hypothetical protein [Singulisphaera acidiphila]AGA29082.1 hypothetical protein Sinac_4926 [Singulisphaera acidiphila DSM 18658]